MPLDLHLSSRSADLLASLLPALAEARARSIVPGATIPRPVPVLVPSSQLSDWLQTRLARDLGLSMGFEFLQPSAFFGRHFSADTDLLAEAHAFWAPENLRWRLLPLVDSIAGHLGHDAGKPLAPRDRFAFAELLARQFDHYARHRPDWPARWSADESVWADESAGISKAALADEAWQRRLWHAVASSPDAPPHPAQVLERLRVPSEAGSGNATDVGGVPLFFVGTDLLDPLTLRTLEVLAHRGLDVRCHLLLPSLGYLGDVNRRDAWRALLAKADDEAAALNAGHPLLASLGRRAAGVFLLLDSVFPDYAAWPEVDPADTAPADASLLRRIQSDIRAQRSPLVVGENGAPDSDARPRIQPSDTSVRVHSCHGPRRELEVLRDELLRAFAELPDLHPEEVLVAVTDFDAYAPLAEGVLRAGEPRLPVRLTAISAREANPVAVALLALLRIALGRRSASELIELLNLSAIRHHLGLADDPETLGRLADAIRVSGLTHGTDAGDRASGVATGTWRTALDRHLAGAWFGADETASDAQGALAHPLAADLAGADDATLRFVAWLTRFARHLLAWREDAPAAQWAGRLERAIDELLHSDEQDDHAAALRRMLGELAAAAAPTPLDVGAMLDWLQPRLENATSLRTTLGGEILFGRIDQIHGLPCRVLAILGLQDGSFPRPSRRPAWDLLSARAEKWDNDPRSQDRQWFLDCLLAPSDRLILSASNRSLRSAHDGPLSSCVEELLRAAAATVRPASDDRPLAGQLVVPHRIQPFSTDYFRADAVLPRSFNNDAARITADLINSHAFAVRPFFNPRPDAPPVSTTPSDAPLEITLGQLMGFWKDPARAWLRALQIEVPEDESDDSTLDDSPLNPDGLQSYEVRRAALECRLDPASSRSPDATGDRLIADRTLPPGALGALSWKLHSDEISELAAHLRARRALVSDHALRVALGSCATLVGEVKLGDADSDAPWLLFYRPASVKKPKYGLEAFVQALAATAHLGRPVEALVFGVDIPEGKPIPAPPVKTALALLDVLLSGYRLGQHAPLCFAPEASTAMVKALSANDDERALDDAASKWYADGDFGTGEGQGAAARIVWRDADPFAAPHDAAWLAWARGVAVPFAAWWDGKPVPVPETSASDA